MILIDKAGTASTGVKKNTSRLAINFFTSYETKFGGNEGKSILHIDFGCYGSRWRNMPWRFLRELIFIIKNENSIGNTIVPMITRIRTLMVTYNTLG